MRDIRSMIAIIKGDIMASRKLNNPELWLLPLKKQLSSWGQTPYDWELAWGDSFQLEISNPEWALHRALSLKALIRQITEESSKQQHSSIDLRLSIGIGEKTYAGNRVSESNGPAYVRAGAQFDQIKKEHCTLGINSPWPAFDEDMNLYFRLAATFMDHWTTSSATLISMILQHPDNTQKELGAMLGIRQNSVSGRWKRAYATETVDLEHHFRKRVLSLLDT
jgi:hypothetical protein